MSFEAVFNLLEATLWFGCALVLALRSCRKAPELRRALRFSAVVFVAFGLSDLVECKTGSWWEPWWLAVWKVSCVIALIAALTKCSKLDRRPSKIAPGPSGPDRSPGE